MFSVSTLLDKLSTETYTDSKKLEKALKLTKKNERRSLEIALDALCKVGILENNENNNQNVKVSSNSNFIKARIRCSNKGFCFAIREDEQEHIYIRDQDLNHAWHGDYVLVKISKEAVRRRSAEGVVLCVVKRNTKQMLCRVEKEGTQVIGIPLDDRVTTKIILPEIDSKHIVSGLQENLVEISIDKYPIAQYEAEGHVVRKLPLDAGIKGDVNILTTKVNIENKKPPTRSALRQPTDKDRQDFTGQDCLIFKSWEQENSPELPAIYIERIESGYKLWVHSPSVSERLSIGSPLDHWLRERGESHCLGENWIPLLNQTLTKASSLEINKTNHTISLSMDIDLAGKILDWEFCLGTVRPVNVVSPEILEAISERKPKSRVLPKILKPLKESLQQINDINECANKLLVSQKENGLVELDISQPSMKELGDINWEYPGTDFTQWKHKHNLKDPQSTLNIIFRTSNYIFYRHAKALGLPFLSLESESIDVNVLNDVAKSAISLDVKLELNNDGIPKTNDLISSFSTTNHPSILSKLLRHALPSPKLKAEAYISKADVEEGTVEDRKIQFQFNSLAPWCCPTLHYHDIINQNIISSLIKEGKSKATPRSKTKVNLGQKGCESQISWNVLSDTLIDTFNRSCNDSLSNDLNRIRVKAKKLRNSIIAMRQARSLEPLLNKEVEATISGVQSYGFFAEIAPSLVEGLVHVSSLNDDWYEYRSRQCRLIGRKNRKVFQLGDKVRVRVLKIDVVRNQIDLENVEAEGQTTSEDIIELDKSSSNSINNNLIVEE